MQVEKISEENFKEVVLDSTDPVLVDFYADWCAPCKMLSPIVDEVANENEDLKVVKINIDESPNVAIEYNVMSIPTLVLIRDGKETARSVGVVEKEQIENMFNK